MKTATEEKKNRFTKYFPLLLDALRSADPDPMRPAQALAWIRANASVSDDDLVRHIKGGSQSIFENDVHWTRFYLVKAGLISNAKRGFWSLTPEGHGTHLTPDETWDLYVRIRDANRPENAASEDEVSAPNLGEDSDDSKAYWFVGALWEDDLAVGRRLVIDTKFASVLGTSRFGSARLKSPYIYQMYTYLRSQEGLDPLWDGASGLFLHPAVDIRIRESVTIQGHAIAFATVNLAAEARTIRAELRDILSGTGVPINVVVE